MASAILFVVGASGVGKTASVRELARRGVPGVACFHFDDIGVPSAEEMARDYGGGEGWQAAMTTEWIRRLAGEPCRVAVLDGQTRPSFIAASMRDLDTVPTIATVLLDCTPEVRDARLGRRGQPDLATEHMHRWAAYLRGQADALDVQVIDTSERTIAEVADAVREVAEGLLRSG